MIREKNQLSPCSGNRTRLESRENVRIAVIYRYISEVFLLKKKNRFFLRSFKLWENAFEAENVNRFEAAARNCIKKVPVVGAN